MSEKTAGDMPSEIDAAASPSAESTMSAVDRRTFLSLSSLGAAGVATAATVAAAAPAAATELSRHPQRGLRFGRDGKFKIVQFNDTQDDEKIDRRTLELMRAVLDDEQPDLVILNGDNITGGCDTPLEMHQAMNNVV